MPRSFDEVSGWRSTISDIEGLFLERETRASKCLYIYIYIQKIWNFNFGSIPRWWNRAYISGIRGG